MISSDNNSNINNNSNMALASSHTSSIAGEGALVPVPVTPPPSPSASDGVGRIDNSSNRNGASSSNTSNITSNNTNTIVKLDVGGMTFTTSLSTLIRVPGSYFKSMCNFSGLGRHNNNNNNNSNSTAETTSTMSSAIVTSGENGFYYFIDRDGKHFRHILNYLRCGAVVTLPRDNIDKGELAIEADFYGLDDLVHAIHRPPLDVNEYLPQSIIAYQEEERKLRAKFVNGDYATATRTNANANVDVNVDAETETEIETAGRNSVHERGFGNSPTPPYLGLVSLFSTPSNNKDDDGYDGDISLAPKSCPLRYDPTNTLRNDPSSLFLSEMKNYEQQEQEQEQAVTVTVSTLEEFTANFNKEHPNILHRIGDILRTENVIIAGGSVVRALMSTNRAQPARDYRWGKSDIDLFLYGVTKKEANRIVRRIFITLAVDHEKWVIVRSRGVINIHNEETKIQVVLRLYDTPTEILIGFDVDCCCCCYNGRDVKASRRCLSALISGVNVLNSIHSWPNKPSYELRLGKYASRGFAVYVPGLPKTSIGYNERIQKSKLKDLKGVARFIKVAMEMDNSNAIISHSYRPTDRIQALRGDVVANMTTDELIANGLADEYDGDLNDREIIIPNIYGEEIGNDYPTQYQWWFHDFSNASLTRDTAIETIINCTDQEVPENIPRRLDDAWVIEKRSREYLNDQMDKFDIDGIYYGYVYDTA